jgi:dinuclear metal center YbgI/SA1388 family protein
MQLSSIINILESEAPLRYQEAYDNSGLNVGEPQTEVTGILLCVDVTIAIIDEAVKKGLNLIVSHHPVLFTAIKQLTGKTITEKTVLYAIRKGVALYCMHTNLDNVIDGVNCKICEKLELTQCRVLVPAKSSLRKLVTFVPNDHAEKVRMALFDAGAGHIGNYDSCSYAVEGTGSFRAKDGATPFVGEIGTTHYENEVRIETVVPVDRVNQVIAALLKSHPYEEVAYDVYLLENEFGKAGSGMVGALKTAQKDIDFLREVKKAFRCDAIRHSELTGKMIQKVAVCGGSGAFLIPAAGEAGADIFITGEIKYHQFFDAGEKIIVADIGHYESEQYTVEIFYDILIKKLPNFAIHFSSVQSSPVYYL